MSFQYAVGQDLSFELTSRFGFKRAFAASLWHRCFLHRCKFKQESLSVGSQLPTWQYMHGLHICVYLKIVYRNKFEQVHVVRGFRCDPWLTKGIIGSGHMETPLCEQTNKQTDLTENITFLQTTGGKELRVSWTSLSSLSCYLRFFLFIYVIRLILAQDSVVLKGKRKLWITISITCFLVCYYIWILEGFHGIFCVW